MILIFPIRPLLWFDAATCVATGLLLAVSPMGLQQVLGLPLGLLQEGGVFLLVYAVFVVWVAIKPEPAIPALIVIAANFVWAIGSFALVAGPWIAPTPLGTVFVAGQAAAVAGLAILQLVAVRRTSAST